MDNNQSDSQTACREDDPSAARLIDRPVAAPNRDIRNSTIRVRVGASGNKTKIRRQLR